MKSKNMQIGRLALRGEGDTWVAYYAPPDTMQDAIVLGSIRLALVNKPERRAAFMDLMRAVVADIIEEQTGVRPTWGGEGKAPEHERSGRA